MSDAKELLLFMFVLILAVGGIAFLWWDILTGWSKK